MTSTHRVYVHGLLAVALLVLPTVLLSAERRANSARDAAHGAGETVEMFAAMNSKDIEVTLIPKDETESRVIIKNNTDQPLERQAARRLCRRAGAGSARRRAAAAELAAALRRRRANKASAAAWAVAWAAAWAAAWVAAWA